MLSRYTFLEHQTDAIAKLLVRFESLYDRCGVPPWNVDCEIVDEWKRFRTQLEEQVQSAEISLDRAPVKPLRSNQDPLRFGGMSHRSHCELLVCIAHHRLANVQGLIAPRTQRGNADLMWANLRERPRIPFVGVGWVDHFAVEAACELRQAAHIAGPEDIDITDELLDHEEWLAAEGITPSMEPDSPVRFVIRLSDEQGTPPDRVENASQADVAAPLPTNGEGSQNPKPPNGEDDKLSPWIDSTTLKAIVIRTEGNKPSEKTLQRRKKKWDAESKPNTNNQQFRFKLRKLKEEDVKYPPEWDEPDT